MRTETRSDHPGDKDNWALDCSVQGCGTRFPEDQTVGVIAAHWSELHPDESAGWTPDAQDVGTKPTLNLVWIGVGQPPKGRS